MILTETQEKQAEPAFLMHNCGIEAALFDSLGKQEETPPKRVVFLSGDPYGNRTHVTAVKGRCLNRLTNGPGSGDLIRTGDIPGMNRLLYQLSYAAIFQQRPKSALLLYLPSYVLSREKFIFLVKI